MGNTEELFQEWIVSLKHKQPAARVKSFYHANKCVLTTQVKYRRFANTAIPTDHQLRQLLSGLTPHDQAVFLTLVESGERIGATYALQTTDVRLDHDYPLIIFDASKTKVGVTHPSFIGKAAKQAILALKPSNQLFNHPFAERKHTHPCYRPYLTLYNRLSRQSKTLGFKFTPHMIRKRYARKCMDAKVPASVIDTLSNGLIGTRPITLDETTHCPMNYIFDPTNIQKLRKIYTERIYPAIKLV